MPIQPVEQTSFTGGEISPLVAGRSDSPKYLNSMELVSNYIVDSRGPLLRRGSTRYLTPVKNQANVTYLIPYVLSPTQAYMVEFGNNYLRFYRYVNGVPEPILSGAVPYEVATAYTTAQLPRLKISQYVGVLYIEHPEHPERSLIRMSDTSWSLTDDRFLPPPTEPLGVAPNATITPAAVSGLDVTFTTSTATFLAADVGRRIITTSGIGRASITSISNPTTAIATILDNFASTAPIPAGQWKLDLFPFTDVTPSTQYAGNMCNVAAQIAAFRPEDVGKYILIHNGVIHITSVSGDHINATGEIQKSLDSKEKTGVWSVEDAVWTAVLGYPRASAIYQGRLFKASTNFNPQGVWASASGSFDNFGIGANDADALSFDLGSEGFNEILWLSSSQKALLVGTSDAIYGVSATGKILKPSDLGQDPEAFTGSADIAPVKYERDVIYIDASRQRIRSIYYNKNLDGYETDDLTYLSPHLFEAKIKQLAMMSKPDGLLWALRDDGVLLCCTLNRQQNVLGWSRFQTDGEIETIAILPNNAVDELWMVVKRTVNGQTKRYIETYNPVVFGTDCYKHYTGSTFTVITGLEHLEGKTVKVKADNAAHPVRTVQSGQITLQETASDVYVGLSYLSKTTTLEKAMSNQLSYRNSPKRYIRPMLLVSNSSIPTWNNIFEPSRKPDDYMDLAVPLYSGWIEYGPDGYTSHGKVSIQTSDVFPLIILALAGTMDINVR